MFARTSETETRLCRLTSVLAYSPPFASGPLILPRDRALHLVAEVAFVIAFDTSPFSTLPVALQFVLVTLAALCFVIGGLVESLDGVDWYRLVGAGEIVWGIHVVLTGYPSILGAGGFAGGGSLPAVVYLLSGLIFAFIGFDWFRGGRYFSLSA